MSAYKMFKGTWAQRNPEKMAAQRQVKAAVKNGLLARPLVCERCHEDKGHKIHGHHDDYSKPLDVMWLCPACHRRRHDEINGRKVHWTKRYPAELLAEAAA